MEPFMYMFSTGQKTRMLAGVCVRWIPANSFAQPFFKIKKKLIKEIIIKQRAQMTGPCFI
jgi:hypothetical protein